MRQQRRQHVYFITGIGSAGRYDFSTRLPGSQVRYNADFGTMLIQASDTLITFEFISVTGGGTGMLIDSFTIGLPSAVSPVAATKPELTSDTGCEDMTDPGSSVQIDYLL